MKKILFPTDFSLAAQNAFKYAMDLSKHTGWKIDVVHIYQIPFSGTEYYLAPSEIEQLRLEKQRLMEEKIESFCKKFSFKNVDKQMVFPGFFTEQELIELSRDENYGLVIMGTKGERNALDKLMGSVTTRLMMNAGCPVLAIPDNAVFKKFQHIAYATTFSTKDQHFLEQLVDFGKNFEAEIHFVYVSEKEEGGAEEKLFVPGLPSRFVKFSVVNNSSITDGIDEFVKNNQIDLLAIYIPKRNLWERLFHNSFSKKMTFHTEIPLFVFHG